MLTEIAMKLTVTKQSIAFIVLMIAMITGAKANENINQFCAKVVGISYASDNFTDEEWQRFEYCRNTLIENTK